MEESDVNKGFNFLTTKTPKMVGTMISLPIIAKTPLLKFTKNKTLKKSKIINNNT
jgi:hypothetical protein